MAERVYAVALREGARVDAAFALRAREVRSARTGEAYLSLELADKTGRVGGVMFRPGREECAIPAGTVVHVRGVVTSYRGMVRISVESMRPAAEYDPREIVPSGTRDQGELVAELRRLVRAVRHPGLRAVVTEVFRDRAFLERFKLCPASQGYHHAWLGGLLEHTVSVAGLCLDLAARYPRIDADLLLAGALLHDIGKVDELSFETGIQYTDQGRLLGHVVLGERRVSAAVASLGDAVPPELAARLSHVLLSHHGELEWGSPKRPSVLEALVLHHADNLDAKTVGFIEAASSALLVEEPWTDAANLFRRPLWAPRPLEDDRWRPPAEDEQYAMTA
jgi:3'-5' exoribonuclease